MSDGYDHLSSVEASERAERRFPANLAPEDRRAWLNGELVIGTDGHVVAPKGEPSIEQSLNPESW